MKNKIIALITALSMLFSMTAMTAVSFADEAELFSVAIPEESELLYIANDDFSQFAGMSDSSLRSELSKLGYKPEGEGADKLSFSASAEKGLFMKRSGTTAELKLSRRFANDNEGITLDNTLIPGFDIKAGGKYYIDFTYYFDKTSIYINGCENWKNVYLRTTINKGNAGEVTIHNSPSYSLADEKAPIHIQYIIDAKDGNANGTVPKCSATAYVNGQLIADGIDNLYKTGGKSYYPKFLAKIDFILQKSNVFDGSGLYLKDFKFAKVLDASSSEFSKKVARVAPSFVGGDDKDNVKGNINLTTSFEGLNISWESSDANVVSPQGVVKTPMGGDRKIALTATISDGKETVKQKYFVNVKGIEGIDKYVDSVTYSSITNGEADGSVVLAMIVNSLKLPKSFENGGTITWTSTNPDVVNPDTGVVTNGKNDVDVTIKAVFERDGIKEEKEFRFTVKRDTTSSTIDDDLGGLTDELVLGENKHLNEIWTDLNLINKGLYAESDIKWTASIAENNPVDLATGVVTRPEFGKESVSLTLTATLSKGGETRTKNFDITVVPLLGATDNLALGKKTSAGDVYMATNYQPKEAVDGNRTSDTSRWAGRKTEGNFLTIDLGTPPDCFRSTYIFIP